jgi:hypothetical protein
MTDLYEHLLTTIRRSYTLTTRGAAVAVADIYLSQILAATEAGLERGTPTEDDLGDAALMFGHGERTDELLAAIEERATTAREALAERDDLIVAALATTRPRPDIAAAAGLANVSRLYQIRDEQAAR